MRTENAWFLFPNAMSIPLSIVLTVSLDIVMRVRR